MLDQLLSTLEWCPSALVGHDAFVAHYTAQARAELAKQGAWCPAVALPAWLAPVAKGEAVPSLGIPAQDADAEAIPEGWGEIVDIVRALGRHVSLPPSRPMPVEISGRPLHARRAERFDIDLELLAPAVSRTGPTWTDSQGRTWLLPAPQLHAIHEVALGPPDQRPGTSQPEWSDDRFLWWSQRQERLKHAGLALRGPLGALDVQVWDRLRPKLVQGESGELELTVAPGGSPGHGLDSDASVKMTLLQLQSRPDLHPHIRHDGRKVRVVVTQTGRRAISTLFDANRRLRSSPEAAAILRDAPEALLPPDLFDLDDYTDRVIGIAMVPPVYRPRAAGRERWTFVDGGGSGARPALSEGQWADVWAELHRAAQDGRQYVFVHGHWFRVPPVQTDAPEAREGVPKAELQVRQNIDELNYVNEDEGSGRSVDVPLPPPGLAPRFPLYDHQTAGVRWLAGHASWDEGSSDHGMLADDMGLGKTIQVLSLMSLLLDQGTLTPMLLVAPLSLLHNWRAEADKFFPGRFGRPLLIGGPDGARNLRAEHFRRARWTLASYEAVRSQQLELGRVHFELIVLDESHRIKNPSAGVTRAMLAMHARRRLALTGTPVQNRLSELWSQFDWLAPGWLGDLSQFDQKHADDGDAEALERLRNLVGPRILRRMKRRTMADQLPPLHDSEARHRPRLQMDRHQASLYDQVVHDKSQDGKQGSFGMLHRLFQVCACPGMVADTPISDPKRAWLWGLLRDIQRAGEKVLIFAEWYELQDQLTREIAERFSVFADRVNGKVPAGERLERVDRFNASKGFAVLILGPRAGGVGLNITGANHVVHYTRHWNPALEAQATDRAYRIGQTRPVHVYRPIVEHPDRPSIEVYLDGLLREKEALAEQVIVPSAQLNVRDGLAAAVGGDR